MRRSTRQRKAPIHIDETEGYIQSSKPKGIKKIAVQPLETRPADDPPPPEVKAATAQPTTTYSPPVQVGFTPLQIHWIEDEPITLFLKFLGQESIAAIVTATNARALYSPGPHQQYARTWSPLTAGELLCWLGILLYIVNYTGKRKDEQWSVLRRFMSHYRWDQIHRFLTFNIATTSHPDSDKLSEQTHSFLRLRLEPVYSIVKSNCQNAVTSSSWVSV